MNLSRKSIWLIISLVLGLTTFLFTAKSSIAKKSGDTTATTDTAVYLPVSLKYFPWITTFGAQVMDFNVPGATSLAQESGLNWVRVDAFNWSRIEPQNTNPSGYNWNAIDDGINEKWYKSTGFFKGVGNYWDDYTGVDKNGDGFGDTPYSVHSVVGEEHLDRFPFMEPVDIDDVVVTDFSKDIDEFFTTRLVSKVISDYLFQLFRERFPFLKILFYRAEGKI